MVSKEESPAAKLGTAAMVRLPPPLYVLAAVGHHLTCRGCTCSLQQRRPFSWQRPSPFS
jgi:hypothetical protein